MILVLYQQGLTTNHIPATILVTTRVTGWDIIHSRPKKTTTEHYNSRNICVTAMTNTTTTRFMWFVMRSCLFLWSIFISYKCMCFLKLSFILRRQKHKNKQRKKERFHNVALDFSWTAIIIDNRDTTLSVQHFFKEMKFVRLH